MDINWELEYQTYQLHTWLISVKDNVMAHSSMVVKARRNPEKIVQNLEAPQQLLQETKTWQEAAIDIQEKSNTEPIKLKPEVSEFESDKVIMYKDSHPPISDSPKVVIEQDVDMEVDQIDNGPKSEPPAAPSPPLTWEIETMRPDNEVEQRPPTVCEKISTDVSVYQKSCKFYVDPTQLKENKIGIQRAVFFEWWKTTKKMKIRKGLKPSPLIF